MRRCDSTAGSQRPGKDRSARRTGAANTTTSENDKLFSDGTSTEMLSLGGSHSSGHAASITVGISA